MKNRLLTILLKLLFYRSPKISFTEQEIEEYNNVFNDANRRGGLIEYSILFPKQRFVQYISQNKNVLIHGSNDKTIAEFEPRRQTLYNGKFVDAVFASKDGFWPLFFAVLDKKKIKGNIRNGCLETKGNHKYYFFSLTRETYLNNPWTNGMLYFFPNELFTKTSNEIVSFDEWISNRPVKPIARLEVGPEDFYFMDKVAIHLVNEPIIISWLLYKLSVTANA